MEQPEAGGITLTIVKPSQGKFDDQLAHKFCPMCKAADKIKQVKPRPYCGKVKEGPWVTATPEDQMCVVCDFMVEKPCPRCGEMRFV